jgi:hypothetical protein
MAGFTFDTGALVALERRHATFSRRVRYAMEQELDVVVPAPVLTEWWRGRTDIRERILEFVVVEPLDGPLARLAGEAMAVVRGATAVDAIVMASAARRGDVVYTSDVDDLMRLQRFFPGIRVFGV